jgi:hypothetical protein
VVSVVDEDKEDEDDFDGEYEQERPVVSSTRHSQGLSTRSMEEERIVQKAMSTLTPPSKFSGESDAEKERVEQWVKSVNVFLDGKFRGVYAPRERMTYVLQLLHGPALDWVYSVWRDEEDQSWEELQTSFIQHIRGSMDSREQINQKMKALTFGKAKCRDLLSYDSAFEQLRVKLYPTSTFNREMNERSGEDYMEGIRRGDRDLYIELRRCLSSRRKPGKLPTLAECKAAAADAYAIVNESRQLSRTSSNFSSYPGRSSQQSSSRPTVNNVDVRGAEVTEEVSEEGMGGEAEASVSVQRANVSSNQSTRGGNQSKSYELTEKEKEQLKNAGKCFRCYTKGHRSSNIDCPGRGKPRRAPTAEQLKA